MTGAPPPGPLLHASGVDALMLAIIHAAAFPPGEAWGAEAMALTLELPGSFGLYRPGGGMILARTAGAEAEVLTLAVVPAARRQGLGGTLLAAAMAEAAGSGADELFLEVSVENDRARSLYAAAGFAEVGRRRGYYADGSDALVLRAVLSRPAGSAGR